MKRKMILVLVGVFCLLLLLTGCSSAGAGGEENDSSEKTADEDTTEGGGGGGDGTGGDGMDGTDGTDGTGGTTDGTTDDGTDGTDGTDVDLDAEKTALFDGSAYDTLELIDEGSAAAGYQTIVRLIGGDSDRQYILEFSLFDESNDVTIDPGTYPFTDSPDSFATRDDEDVFNVSRPFAIVRSGAGSLPSIEYLAANDVYYLDYYPFTLATADDEITDGSVTVTRTGDDDAVAAGEEDYTYEFSWAFTTSDEQSLSGSFTGTPDDGTIPSGSQDQAAVDTAISGDAFAGFFFDYLGAADDDDPSFGYETIVSFYVSDFDSVTSLTFRLFDATDDAANEPGTYEFDDGSGFYTVPEETPTAFDEDNRDVQDVEFWVGETVAETAIEWLVRLDYAAAGDETVEEMAGSYEDLKVESIGDYDEIEEGTVTVTETDGTYTFSWSFTTVGGTSLTGSYTGTPD